MNYLLAGIIGLVSGLASGLFGVGGGIVMVPAMIFLLSPPIRDIKQAVGTSLVVIIPTALMGSYKHFTQGNVHWQTALALAPTAILGGYAGAWLTTQLSADNLKRAFGGFLILVGYGCCSSNDSHHPRQRLQHFNDSTLTGSFHC